MQFRLPDLTLWKTTIYDLLPSGTPPSSGKHNLINSGFMNPEYITRSRYLVAPFEIIGQG